MSLREKCPNTDFFLVHNQSKCGKIRTRKNSGFGHFSSSGTYSDPSVSGAALARGLPLFELRHLLEEIWL